MVVVPGATVLEVTSAKELMAQITAGQTHRHVASTQVNRLHHLPAHARDGDHMVLGFTVICRRAGPEMCLRSSHCCGAIEAAASDIPWPVLVQSTSVQVCFCDLLWYTLPSFAQR